MEAGCYQQFHREAELENSQLRVRNEQLEAENAELREQLEAAQEKKEEFESALLQVRKALCGDIHNQDDILELAEAAQKDAERYRWLRQSRSISNNEPFICRNFCASFSQWTGEHADQAIDAAMKEGSDGNS